MEDLLKYAKLRTWSIKEFSSLKYQYPISTHDQNAIKCGKKLSQGIPKEELRRMGPFLTAISPQSHVGPYLNAIDFLVPDGTTVLAAQNGKIIEVIECFAKWGDDPKFRDSLNYITIKHKKGEFTQYCHLSINSVSGYGLSVGSTVKAGQPIARVGKTGWTDRDHLHFIVFRRDDSCTENPFGFRSLQVKFV